VKRVLVAVPDLLFSVQIANAVRGAGGEPVVIRRADEAFAALASENAALPAAVVIDLAARIDPPQVIEAAAAHHIPVFAFGPHLDTAAILRARACGAQKVVANSALSSALPGWLSAQLAGRAASDSPASGEPADIED
jgi:DNA-binding NarL/FixJ family response regulator